MNKLRLREKGWSEPDIRRAEQLLHGEEKHDAHFARMVFWTLIAIVVIGHLLISLVLIPFLVVLNSTVLISIVILLGLVLGSLYTLLIMDIGFLQRKHHLSAGILLPLVALVSVAMMTITANKAIIEVGVENAQHNPFVIGVVFAGAFIVPYLFKIAGQAFRRKNSST